MPDALTVTYKPCDWLTAAQRTNLTILADTLDNVARLTAIEQAHGIKRFDMTYFQMDLADLDGEPEDCGTVACAAGHGPAAGIPRLPYEQWGAYAARAFGADSQSSYSDGTHELFSWLFSGGWSDNDNTPTGAARRVRVALEKGLPIFRDEESGRYDIGALLFTTNQGRRAQLLEVANG